MIILSSYVSSPWAHALAGYPVLGAVLLAVLQHGILCLILFPLGWAVAAVCQSLQVFSVFQQGAPDIKHD